MVCVWGGVGVSPEWLSKSSQISAMTQATYHYIYVSCPSHSGGLRPEIETFGATADSVSDLLIVRNYLICSVYVNIGQVLQIQH